MYKFILVISLFLAISAPVYASDMPDPQAVIGFINQARIANGLKPFTEVLALDKAATLKAQEIAGLGALVHTKAPSGNQWWETTTAGYTFAKIGENLAANVSDPATLVSLWMNSPEHRANILDPDFTDIGVASVPGVFEGDEGSYTVQYTASPESASAPIQLSVVQTQALIASLRQQLATLMNELTLAMDASHS